MVLGWGDRRTLWLPAAELCHPAAGFHVRRVCSELTGTECSPCPAGTYTAHPNGLRQCLHCQACEPGVYCPRPQARAWAPALGLPAAVSWASGATELPSGGEAKGFRAPSLSPRLPFPEGGPAPKWGGQRSWAEDSWEVQALRPLPGPHWQVTEARAGHQTSVFLQERL